MIQYYFFYPFNASANRHEGDWEHINVILNSQNLATATIQRVEYYFHHRYMNCYTPGVDYYVVGGTHPKVYVGGYISSGGLDGSGSHGSYPKAKGWDNVTFTADEYVHGDGLHIDFGNYNNVIILPEPDKIEDNSNLSWLIFKGQWGHLLTTPSAWDLDFPIADFLFNELGIEHLLKIDFPEDVGNLALFGPPYQSPWNNIGPNSGQNVYP